MWPPSYPSKMVQNHDHYLIQHGHHCIKAQYLPLLWYHYQSPLPPHYPIHIFLYIVKLSRLLNMTPKRGLFRCLPKIRIKADFMVASNFILNAPIKWFCFQYFNLSVHLYQQSHIEHIEHRYWVETTNKSPKINLY